MTNQTQVTFKSGSKFKVFVGQWPAYHSPALPCQLSALYLKGQWAAERSIRARTSPGHQNGTYCATLSKRNFLNIKTIDRSPEREI